MPDCDEMLDLISARLDGPLSPEQEAVLEDHLAGCPACRALQADFEALHAAFGELAAHPAPPPPDLLEGVLAQIHAGQSESRRHAAQGRRTRPWRAWAAMAAVFAIVIAGAASLNYFGSGGTGSTTGAGRTTSAAVPPQAAPEQVSDGAAAENAAGDAAPAEDVTAQETEKSMDASAAQPPENPALADAGPGAAFPTSPMASPYLPAGSAAPPLAGVLPRSVLRSGLPADPAEGGAVPYAEQTAAPESLSCGILTLPWSDTLDLSGLEELAYTQEGGTRSYVVSAAEFEALVQAHGAEDGAAVRREGDGVDPAAEQGLLIVTGAPEGG